MKSVEDIEHQEDYPSIKDIWKAVEEGKRSELRDMSGKYYKKEYCAYLLPEEETGISVEDRVSQLRDLLYENKYIKEVGFGDTGVGGLNNLPNPLVTAITVVALTAHKKDVDRYVEEVILGFADYACISSKPVCRKGL